MDTILIIDDDHDLRSNFRELLELENYQTLEAENGLVGLHIMQQYAPDIVICDIDMPVMTGIELLRTVKAEPQIANIPFVVLTGQHNEHTLKLAHALGVTAYLTKPVAISDFLSTIVYHLEA